MSTKAVDSDFPVFVILRDSEIELDIGDETGLLQFFSGPGKLKWSSSSSAVASVSKEGTVTAKKAGTAVITAKCGDVSRTCRVRVRKTVIETDVKTLTMERGDRYRIRFSTSNGHTPVFRTNKSSVATVDDTGLVEAYKPGEAVIRIKCDGTEKTVKVTVKKPDIKLNRSEIKLYPGEMFKLNASVSSKAEVKWKSGKKKVALVDHEGRVIAQGAGTAIITVSADGASAFCLVTVVKPKIVFKDTVIELKAGESIRLEAKVTPAYTLQWSTSNEKVLTVSEDGTVTALKKGKAYVYAKTEGAKEKCLVTVIGP